jgi:hypothetical protein
MESYSWCHRFWDQEGCSIFLIRMEQESVPRQFVCMNVPLSEQLKKLQLHFSESHRHKERLRLFNTHCTARKVSISFNIVCRFGRRKQHKVIGARQNLDGLCSKPGLERLACTNKSWSTRFGNGTARAFACRGGRRNSAKY